MKEGDRVRLRSVDGEPQEVATVCDVDESYECGNSCVVQVDPTYLTGPDDDGLRECMEEDIVEVLGHLPFTGTAKLRFGLTDFGAWRQSKETSR